MTASLEEGITVPQAMLEVYGALDLLVMQRPELASLVDQYLPGASEHVGWSTELYGLFAPDVPRLNDVASNVRAGLEKVLAVSTNPGLVGDNMITIPDLSNLVYAIGALSHIPDADPGDNLYGRVLALAVPETVAEGEELAVANEFLANELPKLSGYDAWPNFIKSVAGVYVAELVAAVPQCRTSVVTVNGYESVVIDADLTSDTVSFNRLINVIDPRNWPKSYPSFFCHMGPPKKRDDDDWYDIKETAGLCKVVGGYTLTTRLKFIKSNQKVNLDARLDYDLSENQTDCDGKVKVDKGFINVLCTNKDDNPTKGGVLMRTRKVAHVIDISPFAQAFWLCKLGYGWSAVQAFFGPAMKEPPVTADEYTYWNEAPLKMENPNKPDPGTGTTSTNATNTSQTGADPTTTSVLQVATKTAETWKDTAEFLTDTYLTTTKKWLAGQLSFGDLAKYGGAVGAKLASEPWLWLQKITTEPTSGSSDGSTGSTP